MVSPFSTHFVHGILFAQDPLLSWIENSHDQVVLSLVVNFEGDPRVRARMLQSARSLLRPNSSLGLCFVILPIACVENSRYLTNDLFIEMMRSLGFALRESKMTAKLAMYVFAVDSSLPVAQKTPFPRRELNSGPTRNNFCIIFKYDDDDNQAGDGKFKKKKGKGKLKQDGPGAGAAKAKLSKPQQSNHSQRSSSSPSSSSSFQTADSRPQKKKKMP